MFRGNRRSAMKVRDGVVQRKNRSSRTPHYLRDEMPTLVIDRRREFGLLRFLGGATSQIRRLILFEAGLLGLLANLAGMVLGVCLSLLLIYVINKQSFGWTIHFHWPVGVLLGALTLIYAATVVAALYPARIAMRLNPVEVIHEE